MNPDDGGGKEEGRSMNPGRNIQHSTFNAQPRRTWELNVECFLRFRGSKSRNFCLGEFSCECFSVHGEIGRPTESLYDASPFHEPDDSGGKEEDRPHPGLLPQEKESLFPLLVNLSALSLRWFRGSMREFFGEFSPKSSPPRRGLSPGTRLNTRRPLTQSRRSVRERGGNNVSLSFVPRPLERERVANRPGEGQRGKTSLPG